MKKIIPLFLIILLIAGCKSDTKLFDANVSDIKVNFSTERFEKDYYNPQITLDVLKQKYPEIFQQPIDSAAVSSINLERKDSMALAIMPETQKIFDEKAIAVLNEDITELFQHIQYYFPQIKIKKVITIVRRPTDPAFYDPNTQSVIIPLDYYLGEKSPFYTHEYEYTKKYHRKEQILMDIVESIAQILIPKNGDFQNISQMIYFGKIQLLKEAFLPNTSDEEQMNYTQKELAWVKANEYNCWNYHLQNEDLFKSDKDFAPRFLDKNVPFSKFYTDDDTQIPPRVGVWQGWQIVRKYAENSKLDLKNIINNTDANQMYQISKYKPKK